MQHELKNIEIHRQFIANIYQVFGGIEIYPSLEEKAANLLHFIAKNHSFSDGNKRIAAAMFLFFLIRTMRYSLMMQRLRRRLRIRRSRP